MNKLIGNSDDDNMTLQLHEIVTKPFVGTIIMGLVGLYFALVKPFAGLDAVGHEVLGTIICTLAFWIFKPGGIPYFVGTIVLLVGCVMSGLPMGQVATGYSGTSFWLLMPALFFGFALKKTGLGDRIAFFMLKIIKPSYASILLVWFLLGITFSLLTPSISIRFLMLTTIAVSVADACNLAQGSKERSLIIITGWAAGIFPGTGWYTGSLYGPVLTGFLPMEMQEIAIASWFKVMGLPWIFITMAFLIIIYFLLKPQEKLSISQKKFAELYLALGKITRAEKILFMTLIGVLICLPLQAVIGLVPFQIMLIGFLVLLLTRVIQTQDIGTGVSWDVLLFFGAIIGLSDIIGASGIALWAEPMLQSVIPSLVGNNLTFLLSLTAIFLVLRFIDVTWGYAVAAFLATTTPLLYHTYNIDPAIILMIFTFGGSVFFTSYQQPWIPQAESIMKDRGWNQKHIKQAAYVYAGLIFLTLVIFIPYWKLIGVLQ